MRLESDGLVKVDGGSLVGARANTSVGCGAVISVRDVSVRCEVETVGANDAGMVGKAAANITSSTHDSTGDGTNFDAGEEQQTLLLANESRCCYHARTAEYDGLPPSVLERSSTGTPGSVSEAESTRPRDGHEVPDRGKGQEERCGHAMPSRAVPRRFLGEYVTLVGSNNEPPGEKGACWQVGGDDRRTRDGDGDGESDGWDGCSERTERAEEFGEWATTTAHGRTRQDFEPQQVGAEGWTAQEGTLTASNVGWGDQEPLRHGGQQHPHHPFPLPRSGSLTYLAPHLGRFCFQYPPARFPRQSRAP